ncbi:MAG: hypothetical protein ACI4PL_00765 [Faecousia sp.]
MSISYRENLLRVFAHETPKCLPLMSDFDAVSPGGIDFVCEAPRLPGIHKDWFGQSWTFEPKIGACNPTPRVLSAGRHYQVGGRDPVSQL